VVRRPDQVVRFLAGVNFNHKIGRGLGVCLANGEPSVSRLDASNRMSNQSAEGLRISEQISLGIYNLSLDSARRDKALLVARKLGIDLESYQPQETANSNETDK
jgi:hypothetical protein